MKIAYITYSGIGKYLPANNFNEIEDMLPLLQSKGFDITAAIWDDPTVDWTKYNVALLKTPWDYHFKYEEFKNWLNKIEAIGIKLLNDFNMVRWNMDKHYLKEISSAGFDVIPSFFIDKGWNGELLLFFNALQTEQLIIKPCVSAGSKNTIILHKDNCLREKSVVSSLVAESDYIIQPLMPQIQDGEWSFIFFNGRYSHTIIKKPKAGDFRVQQHFGGTIIPVHPKQKYVDRAADYLRHFAKNAFYARVDGLMVKDEFVLMELELIEPFLYLSYGKNAVEYYCNALQEQLKKLIKK